VTSGTPNPTDINASSNPSSGWRKASLARIALRGGALLVALGSAITLVSPPAGADTASDNRANFFSGNATTCAGIGLASDTQLGSDSNTNASDQNVSGVVKTNAGTVQPGNGEEVDITTANNSVVVDAVMVKGGNGYNVYSDSTFLPPTLGPDQHYISPLNDGGNVPTISHWFVCYHVAPDPSIGITKTADAPSVSAGTPIGFTVTVTSTGSTTATSVALNDPLPAGPVNSGVNWSINPAYTSPGSCSITGSSPSQVLSCSFGDMAPGASASVHITSATSAASVGTYNNTATATASNVDQPVQASASTVVRAVTVTISLGYADGLRTAANATPGSPWEGSPDTSFIGCPNNLCPNGNDVYDGGAVMISNGSPTPLTFKGGFVVIGHCTFTPWGNGITVPAAKGTTPGRLILTQTRKGLKPQGTEAGCPLVTGPTVNDNFDTSETDPVTCSLQTKNDGLIPRITMTINGQTLVLVDGKQILNSGGRDRGCGGKASETTPWSVVKSWTLAAHPAR
jgi:uncharacterized repeat protein (TIGR01451 family)